jgi:D-alanyl-D-alanine carboxypeptidase (penicillin-binding protein 5/6)
MQRSLKNKFLLAFSLVILSFSANSAEFETKAKQAYLLDFNTDNVLFQKNGSEKMGPSSMTKILTSYIAFDAVEKGETSWDKTYIVSELARSREGSRMFVNIGESIKLSDLIQGIVVQSGNDACTVVAEGLSGSEDAFALRMNAVAEKLGMKNSHFKNASGLPEPEHYTTAEDLAILGKRLIADFPQHYHYFSQIEFEWNKIKQQNRNLLLSKEMGADGIKTGHAEEAGYGIVASAIQDGRRLVAVVNGLNSMKERIQASEALLNYGFKNFELKSFFKKGDKIGDVKVWAGAQNSVPVQIDEDVQVLINKTLAENDKFTFQIVYQEPWVAPVKAGTHIANLVQMKNGEVVKTLPLNASVDVKRASYFSRIEQKIQYLLKGSY